MRITRRNDRGHFNLVREEKVLRRNIYANLFTAFVQLLTEIRQAFKDYHVAMPLIISEGDAVAVHMVVTGTHTAPFKGIPAHNKTVHWEILGIMKIRDGVICEQETFRDWFELMAQLQWPHSP